MVVVSRKIVAVRRSRAVGRRDHGQQRARTVLLHLDRRVEHVERALGQQAVHHHAEDLRIHVVDFGLDDDDGVRRRRPSASPISTRRTFGVSGKSRLPAP